MSLEQAQLSHAEEDVKHSPVEDALMVLVFD